MAAHTVFAEVNSREFLEEYCVDPPNDKLLDKNLKAAAAPPHASLPLQSSRVRPSSSVEVGRAMGGEHMLPPSAVTAGPPHTQPSPAVFRDPFLVPSLPWEPIARAQCLKFLEDAGISDSDTFVQAVYPSELQTPVREYHAEVSGRWECRERSRRRLRNPDEFILGARALEPAVVESWEQPCVAPRRKPDFTAVALPKKLKVHGEPPIRDPDRARKTVVAEALVSLTVSFPAYCAKTAKAKGCHESILEDYRKLVRDRLLTFSLGSLANAMRAWRRYTSFLSRLPSPAPPPFPAHPATLSVFLSFVGRGDARTRGSDRSKVKGGGAGAMAVRNGLMFLRDHLELQLPMSDTDVFSSGVSAPVNRKGQAPFVTVYPQSYRIPCRGPKQSYFFFWGRL